MKKNQKKKPGKPPLSKIKIEENTLNEPDASKPYDFGGLPDRDLKKNLGCG
jgi:hypothetical protein